MESSPEPSPLARSAAVIVATTPSPGAAPTLAQESSGSSTLLRALVERLGELNAVVVVVRDESAADLVDGIENVVVLIDPEWEEAAAPVRAGLDFLAQSSEVDEAFIVSMESPYIDAQALSEVSVGRRDAGTLVAIPKYRYVRGGPVLVGRELWPRFLGAEGALDVEALLLAHPQWVTEVRVDFAPPRRIQSRDDLIDIVR